jgi:hypothetical protein
VVRDEKERVQAMTTVEAKRCGRQALGGAAICIVALSSTIASADAGTEAVVELFTSQGCASCRPADEVMADIAKDPNVIALSFSVDYWDYLGWKDTFARPEFTKRQKAYAEGRGDRSVYTPQVVINGRDHVVGSDEAAIRAAITGADANGHGLTVDIEARVEGDRIVVEVPAGAKPPGMKAAVWIASYRQPETVSIDHGENAGNAITYTNIVDHWQVLGMWDGAPMRVDLPLSDIVSDRVVGCAVILQSKRDGKPGPILGAARIDLTQN